MKLNPIPFLVVLYIFFTVAGQLTLKHSVGEIVNAMNGFKLIDFFLNIVTNVYFLGGVFLFGMGSLIWTYLLTRLDISFIYPITASITYALLIFLGWYIFGETLSPLRILGIVIILIGVCLVSQT
ncbi:MAG: EamA family transporter [Holosporales bacterium]|jgi:multidrug transporter EmrE-like cation transporter|nr:EamA family transporter [Holosporales bacterium]